MKKSFEKKLSLNKSTVVNLESGEMDSAKGGYWYTRFVQTCNSWCGCETNWYHCPPNSEWTCP